MIGFKLFNEQESYKDIIRFIYNNFLIEEVELDNTLEKLLKDKPNPKDDKITKVEVNPETDDSLIVYRSGKKQPPVKMGRVLRSLYSDKSDAEIAKLGEQLKALLGSHKGYTWELSDKIVKTYMDDDCPGSCMTGDETQHLIAFYETQNDKIKILLLKKNNKLVGRALIWHDVQGAKNNILMDRVYPFNDDNIVKKFHDYAIKQDWSYRDNIKEPSEKGCAHIGNSNTKKISYQCINIDHVRKIKIPYLDTFRYGTSDGLFTNYKTKNSTFEFKYTDGTKLLNTKLDVSKDSIYTFNDRAINWKSGTWHNGTMEYGIWKSGIWEDGIWKSGRWYNGIWKKGEWFGLLSFWFDGTWEDGTWFDGTFKGGTWKNGTWKSGEFENGIWENGTWEDGTWSSGTWKGGTWIKGSWKTGWIYDPEKKGNFEPDWEWKDKYVKSPINPAKYFAKNNKKVK